MTLVSQNNLYRDYDSKGRLTSTQSSDCSYIKYTYDANGNRISALVSKININPKIDTITCYKSDNGKIDLRPDTGSVYTYLWSNYQSSSAISNLKSGNYAVTITDTNAMQCIKTFSFIEPDSIRLRLSVTDNLCYRGTTGKAVIDTAFLGRNFRYKWSDSSIGFQMTNLSQGSYSVTVSNNYNICNKTTSFTITEPQRILKEIQKTEPVCFGKNTGSLTIVVLDNSKTYSYVWDNGTTSSVRYNLTKGSYRAIATENTTGCKDSMSADITEPTRIQTRIDTIVESCADRATGKFEISTTGGTLPYKYSLDKSNIYNSNQIFTSQSAGSHTIVSLDKNFCTDTIQITIPSINCTNNILNASQNALFTLYPNPNNGVFQLEFSEEVKGKVQVEILSLDGKIIRRIENLNPKDRNIKIEIDNLQSGNYWLILKSDNQVIDQIQFTKD